jgi:uncharacterized protein (AIM24 family)
MKLLARLDKGVGGESLHREEVAAAGVVAISSIGTLAALASAGGEPISVAYKNKQQTGPIINNHMYKLFTSDV